MRGSKSGWLLAVVVAGVIAAGCGDDPVAPTDSGGDGVAADLGPFRLVDVFLRPYAIERPSAAGGSPTPSLVEHYLSGFYYGGTRLATFEWSLPAAIGTVEPKTPNLTPNDATVVVKLRDDGNVPLGLFYVETRARSGADSASMRQRFAVIENTWVKHQRSGFSGDEPEDLTSWPTFLSHPGGPASADSLFFVLSSSASTIRIRRMAAPLTFPSFEQVPDDCMLRPMEPELNNYSSAPKTMPDLAPAALGRREILFSSRMDPQTPERCAGATSCSNKPGLRLWIVPTPSGVTTYFPRVLTRDSTYSVFGRTVWYAFDYEQPKWSPQAANPAARIAFLSNLAGNGVKELWLGDLLDLNGDNRTDSLDNYRRLAPGVPVSAYDWHPDGTRLCAAGSRGLAWVDAASGAVTPIELPDSNLTRVNYPAVFWRSGEHTLIAFQAEAENLRNLFLLDVEENTVTRLLPYPVPVTHNLFPRWHPTRKRLVYVSDYTVMPWANSSPGTTLADRLNPNSPEFYLMPRTYYPTPWVLSLE